ncbi:hypothetical protein LNP74_07780 [Klebsiella pneumoniae subsp. pneumoniae]|nr:hypothetical protein [Klebsiella pneumoniae subsp. pneumoniae]
MRRRSTKPEGVQAVIAGKDQEWLELEAAACDYRSASAAAVFQYPDPVRRDG